MQVSLSVTKYQDVMERRKFTVFFSLRPCPVFLPIHSLQGKYMQGSKLPR